MLPPIPPHATPSAIDLAGNPSNTQKGFPEGFFILILGIMQLGEIYSKEHEERHSVDKSSMDFIKSNLEYDWKTMDSRSEHLIPPTLQLINRLRTHYISSSDKILEIGAGPLINSSDSYLSHFFPKPMRDNIILSDRNKPSIQSARSQGMGQNKYLDLDFCNMQNRIPKNSFDKVIGCATLDTLTSEDLTKALTDIKEVLKPGGKLIHISDIMACTNILLDAYASENLVLFPLFDDNNTFKGVQSVDKEETFIIEKELSKDGEEAYCNLSQFLHWYCSLKPIVRERLLHTICKHTELGIPLCDWVKQLDPKSRKEILKDDVWDQTIQQALVKSGFKIHFCELTSETLFDTQPEGSHAWNYVIWNHGVTQRYHNYVLAPGVVSSVYKFHLVIAEKLPL